jgi:hypothetical protein
MSPKRGSLAGLMPKPAAAPPMPSAPPARQGQEAAAARAMTSEVRSPEMGSPEVRKSERPRQARSVRGGRSRPRTTSELPTSEVRTSEVPTPGVPKYLQLERKDTLLWPGQMAELTVVRRMLNRARGGAGERITENTLIRIGVSLVLARAGELRGTTEEELRQSLGL